MKIKDKIALITGGNSGIGLAIAEEFINNGARVSISGRNEVSLEKAFKHLGNNAIAVKSDVSIMKDIDRLIEKTIENFGKIDILVVNAGVGQFAPVEHVSEEFFDNMTDINFKGAFFTIQKALPHMPQGSSIILIASAIKNTGVSAASIYTATKAALSSFAKSLSAEFLDRGIRVNAINPGPIATQILERLDMPKEYIEGIKEDMKNQTALKRMGNPEEIAKAALFLASDDSAFILGEEINVDGGWKKF